jgi:hypothetical protein
MWSKGEEQQSNRGYLSLSEKEMASARVVSEVIL